MSSWKDCKYVKKLQGEPKAINGPMSLNYSHMIPVAPVPVPLPCFCYDFFLNGNFEALGQIKFLG